MHAITHARSHARMRTHCVLGCRPERMIQPDDIAMAEHHSPCMSAHVPAHVPHVHIPAHMCCLYAYAYACCLYTCLRVHPFSTIFLEHSYTHACTLRIHIDTAFVPRSVSHLCAQNKCRLRVCVRACAYWHGHHLHRQARPCTHTSRQVAFRRRSRFDWRSHHSRMPRPSGSPISRPPSPRCEGATA